MPPRKSSRAAATQSTDSAETSKPAPRSKPVAKRAASPESAEQGSKRARSVKKDDEPIDDEPVDDEPTTTETTKPRASSRSRAPTATVTTSKTTVKEQAPAKEKAPPKEKAPAKEKALPKEKATTTTKPAATKNTKSTAKSNTANGSKKDAAPKKTKTVDPAINSLPSAPEHHRPCAQLFGCGAGNFGQLGMGSDLIDEYNKPKRNMLVQAKIDDGSYGGPGAGLESVAAGGMHTLFMDETGKVWTCGVNDEGALGRLTVNVPNPDKEGEFLDVDELTAVPHPVQALLDENFRAVKIVAGDNISAAISDTGELRVWGSFRGNEGSLGFSSDSKHQFLPVAILDLASHTPRGLETEKAVSFAAGNNHLLVLTNHGNIYALGAGEEGQLGRRVIERRKIHGTKPEKVVLGVRSRKAILVGAGNNHSFAVDESGDLWAWGLNSKGQAGTGVTDPKRDSEVHAPTRVINLSTKDLHGARVVEIAGGDHHTLFLTSDGRVFACGRSDDGQLGLGDADPAFENREFDDFLPEPALVTFPDMNDKIVNISAGTRGNMAVSADGVLYAWGVQEQGELGLGDVNGSKTPQVVVRKTGQWAAIKASCGGQHSVALLRKREAEDD